MLDPEHQDMIDEGLRSTLWEDIRSPRSKCGAMELGWIWIIPERRTGQVLRNPSIVELFRTF
jgi:hypothetical protein